MRTKPREVIIGAALALIPAACLLLVGSPKHDSSVSLKFQRYSDLDAYVWNAAFLWLTNTSMNNYLLTETGNSNTWVLDTFFHRESWMVNCEFNDQTPTGWTNWVQQPSSSKMSNSYLSLGPHSGIVVRVPLPTNGQHRKVAVLYEAPISISPFWHSAIGKRFYRILPPQLKNKVLPPKPVLRRVWCDTELSYPADHSTKNEY